MDGRWPLGHFFCFSFCHVITIIGNSIVVLDHVIRLTANSIEFTQLSDNSFFNLM